MVSPLKKEFDFYLANQAQLVAQYNGRVVVIKDEKVIGDYADQVSALIEAKKTHPVGTFLIQRVSPGNAEYTQTFHSRVSFA